MVIPCSPREKGVSKSKEKNNKKKTTKSKKDKDDSDKVKGPKNAFFCFQDEQRPLIAKEFPDLKYKEISAKLGEKWQELSDNEKEKYNKLAEKEKERYERE